MMRYGVLLAAAAALSIPATIIAKDVASPVIAKALADPARADQAGDDARRHAADVLAFSGVKPGQQVVDFIPGGGYWTRIFSGIVGASGHVYAPFPNLFGPKAQKPVDAINGFKLANVTSAIDPAIITVAKPVDLIWTVENYHDVPNDGRGEVAINAVNAAVLKALKPGGIYVVIDHVAPTGSGLSDTNTLHRIDPAIVKKQVLAAGFQWVGESKALANPKDDHTLKIFDPAIRGHTDQFAFKFRKPLK
jgi:predicted methyltransferase